MKTVNSDIRSLILNKKKPDNLYIMNMIGSGSTYCFYGYFNMVIDFKMDDFIFIDINNKIKWSR